TRLAVRSTPRAKALPPGRMCPTWILLPAPSAGRGRGRGPDASDHHGTSDGPDHLRSLPKRKRELFRAPPAFIASRVRRYRLIPLTEPYIRATYTAHAINLPRTRGQ